jgi:serine O-acetyltransferase
MPMNKCIDQQFDAEIFIPALLKTYDRIAGSANFHGLKPLPQMQVIGQICGEFLELMFPGRCGRERRGLSLEQILLQQLEQVGSSLKGQIMLAYQYEDPTLDRWDALVQADQVVRSLSAILPQIRLKLKRDVQAGYDGDPATKTVREVVLSYPYIKSLTTHRIAHELFKMEVPLIPRMMNEYAHSETGIDIHPGAHIGSAFFIDHGTGTVIGETTVIGDNVKLYQGVTLGALSFPKDGCGSLIRGVKRHPTLEDNVTVYANATILGDITIGENSIIGSNVWIKGSVGPNTMVTIADPQMTIREINKAKTP